MVDLDFLVSLTLLIFVVVTGFALLTNRRDLRVAAFVVSIIYGVIALLSLFGK